MNLYIVYNSYGDVVHVCEFISRALEFQRGNHKLYIKTHKLDKGYGK